ncbi:MAG: hypothetical protein IH984_09320 [Planctomycetes bacterium]|nr:hypothetical protein [Planctomycetota bacterium]
MKFVTTNRFLHRSLLCLSVVALLAMAPTGGSKKHRRYQEKDSNSKTEQPLHAQECSVSIPSGSIVFYKDTHFEGREEVFKIEGKELHEMHDIGGKLSGSISSLRWNLPEGTIVVLYGSSAKNPSRQYVIWGEGQDDRLTGHGVNDKLTTVCIENF